MDISTLVIAIGLNLKENIISAGLVESREIGVLEKMHLVNCGFRISVSAQRL